MKDGSGNGDAPCNDGSLNHNLLRDRRIALSAAPRNHDGPYHVLFNPIGRIPYHCNVIARNHASVMTKQSLTRILN